MKRTVTVLSIEIVAEEEAEGEAMNGPGVIFGAKHLSVKLPENCTIDQAIEALQRVKATL